MASASAAEGSGTENAGKSHPKGLYILFGTEMWERFSYYGMRALLVLYMINQFGWQPSDASTVYKWYTSLVYLFPLLGGYLADKYLGLRLSIIIGGVLMAIGHFLMAFEALPIFYAALGFLVVGNGFFKPNISTMVGRMYTQNDARRDGAFTIFYMGINLGAFLAPLVCGEWLRKNYGFHYGFAAAGVGMLAGLFMFLGGQKQVLADIAAAGNDVAISPKKGDDSGKGADTQADEDEKVAGETGFAGLVAKAWPMLLLAIGAIVPIRAIYFAVTGAIDIKDAVMMCAFSAIAGWMALTLLSIKGKSRDKSTVIFVLFMFTVLFWMAFEQAGNALNIWAEYNTDKHIGSFEYSAESFQSLNPLLIFILAPVFSGMWLFLARKNWNPSTPIKFLIAMIFMVLSFGAMVGGALAENAQVSSAPLAALPSGVKTEKINAGRTTFEGGKLQISGVFPTFAVIEAYEMAADPKIIAVTKTLEEQSKEATPEKPVKVVLESAPSTFSVDLTNVDENVKKAIGGYDADSKTLTITGSLGAEGKRAVLGAAVPPEYRAAIETIAKANESGRVSGFWLFLSYLLATIGELCLSPVGLSMVTKLAPRRFASLFMGVWLLASSVAQYLGGSLGEMWGQIPPTDYFVIFVATSIGGSLVLVVLASPVKKLMHGVS